MKGPGQETLFLHLERNHLRCLRQLLQIPLELFQALEEDQGTAQDTPEGLFQRPWAYSRGAGVGVKGKGSLSADTSIPATWSKAFVCPGFVWFLCYKDLCLRSKNISPLIVSYVESIL